jgi:hypothetical protein
MSEKLEQHVSQSTASSSGDSSQIAGLREDRAPTLSTKAARAVAGAYMYATSGDRADIAKRAVAGAYLLRK